MTNNKGTNMSKFKPIEDYTSTGNKLQDEAYNRLVDYTSDLGGDWYYIDVPSANSLMARDAPSWDVEGPNGGVIMGYTT